SFSDFTLDAKDVSQLPVVGLCPEVRIAGCLNEVDADADCVASLLHATLENVRYAKLLRDLGKIGWLALIALRRSARDHFQIRDLSQPRQDLLLDTVCKISICFVFTQVFKRKHCDAFFWRRRNCW